MTALTGVSPALMPAQLGLFHPGIDTGSICPLARVVQARSMEFDWSNTPFEWDGSLTPRDVEESFEDPFAVRLLPDSSRFSVQARFVNLGRSASGIGIFSVYRTNGKQIRVICARSFDPEEQYFYQRKLNQALGQ